MINFIDECKNTILETQKLLKQNKEWGIRYFKYAEEINANLETIIKHKKRFNEWSPLYLYMNVTEAKGSMKFSLRYLGQDVAKLKVDTDKITISTKGFDKNNERDFGCDVQLKKGKDGNVEWKSADASNFRSYFSTHPKRTNSSRKKNEEHRIESLLLTEFSKRSSKNKKLCNTQPVKLANIARFQMPTPLSESKKIKYSVQRGGGIDIISRIGTGRSTKLCIMEVKDENVSKEPPSKAIQQCLAYATFIRELLGSNSGKKWWKIFGFNGDCPDKPGIYVACVMPSKTNNDTSFAGDIIENDQGSFHLHYIYFEEDDNKIVNIETSLGNCSTKNHI